MKKYLMTGIAALAMGGIFTSCTHDMSLYSGDGTKAVEEKYEQAFVSAYGEPAANQTWGFGSTTVVGTRGMTRSNPGDTYPQTSEGINANGNEWADPDKYYGGWQVPDPLTEGQKERVMKYFQANPNLSFEDPHFRHFFVQQVYKGGTSSPSTTPESITAANNSTYYSSHMNKLTVGQNNLHMNNYNSGDCSVYGNVLNNGEKVGGATHSDKIMLMVNIDDTSCFGYYESGASIQVNNKAALVSAATIDAWAAANGNPGEAVVDKWNRSFMGFDHALKEGADALDAATLKYNDGPESYSYALVNGQVISIDGNNEVLVNGQPIRYASTNTNMYVAAEKTNMGDGDIQAEYRVGGQYMGKYINIDNIMAKLNAGWTPVKDKNLREWVKIGTSDGYFSDWIVTLTEAKRIPQGGEGGGGGAQTVTEEIRVIAEDLSADERSDFDFNDVVFDVYWTHTSGSTENQSVKIVVRAAGGELPIFIGKVDNNYEIHGLFGQVNSGDISTKTMMNTYANAHYDYTCPVINNLDNNLWSGSDIHTIAKSIKVYVHKSGKDFELKADEGKAPGKIAVYTDFTWCDEWDDIDGNESTGDKSGYNGKFSAWVKDKENAAKNWDKWYK